MRAIAKLALAALLMANGIAVQTAPAGGSEKAKVAYVASANREPFHKLSCRWAEKISEKNLQTFTTREQAIKADHRPCKVCKP